MNYVHFGYDDPEDAPILLAGGKKECIENAKAYGGVVYEFDGDKEGILVWGGPES